MTTLSTLARLYALVRPARPVRGGAIGPVGAHARPSTSATGPRWVVAADRPGWEAAELIATLDAGIARRLLARHPADGWCRSCRTAGACSMRLLAEAAARAARPPPDCGVSRSRW